MRISISTLTRAERDMVSGLVRGYEADALSGIGAGEQIERLVRWRRQGWSVAVYHCNILALVIGYQKAKMQCTT